MKACGTLRQLIEAHNKELLSTISSPPAYVCFRQNQDAFVIVHFDKPNSTRWSSSKELGEAQMSKLAYSDFRQGILYDAALIDGIWTRRGSGDDAPAFDGLETVGPWKGAIAKIDQSQLLITHPFANLAGGTTRYSLTIRRSTGRFNETFDVEGPPPRP